MSGYVTELAELHEQIGWLKGALEAIAKGETLGWPPVKYAQVTLANFKKRFPEIPINNEPPAATEGSSSNSAR